MNLFRNQFCKQKSGISMGHALSCIIANFFMNKFENDLKNNSNFPSVWVRYVNKRKILLILNMLNNTKYESIEFTHECESDDQESPFPDLMVKRNDKGKL